jgi:AcrR family transcriptional regulator
MGSVDADTGVDLTPELAPKAPEERRRRILDAAIEVLQERGFGGTRVSDIAAAAGTSPALVLYHFASLNDVLVESLQTLDEQFYDSVRRGLGPAADPRDVLVRMCVLAAEAGPAFGEWELWMEVLVRSRHDPRIAEVRRGIDQRWRVALLDVVKQGVAKGIFRGDDGFAVATRLAALMDGLSVGVVLHDEGASPERMAVLWLDGAAKELGVDPDDLRRRAQLMRTKLGLSSADQGPASDQTG